MFGHRSRVLASCLTFAAAAWCVTPKALSETRSFRIYNAMLMHGAQNLSGYGMPSAKVFYESDLLDFKPKPDGEVGEIDLAKIRKAAAMSQKASYEIVSLDLESFGFSDTGVKNNLAVIDAFKRADPTVVLGIYGVMPSSTLMLYRAYVNTDQRSVDQWERLQAKSEPLAKSVSVLMPSFYTFGRNMSAWVKMVHTAVATARQQNPGKPIYAFVWPQYYAGRLVCKKGDLRGQLIPGDIWKQELDTLYPLVNGIIIWSHYLACSPDGKLETLVFNAQMPWFRQTLEFMRTHGVQ